LCHTSRWRKRAQPIRRCVSTSPRASSASPNKLKLGPPLQIKLAPGRHAMAKLRVPDDRGVTNIDDLQDAIAGHRPARARIATRLAGLRVGALWKPGDPTLISLPGPAWIGAGKPALVDRQIRFRLPGRFVVSEAYGASGAAVSEMFGFGRYGLAGGGNRIRTIGPAFRSVRPGASTTSTIICRMCTGTGSITPASNDPPVVTSCAI
jgi:hypothetical protein